jgi:apolipoprotein D and lipocalin family protein
MFAAAILLPFLLTVNASPAKAPKYGPKHHGPSTVVDAVYDGHCFYPKPYPEFKLESYLGKWYQLAATEVYFSKGCSCVSAEYKLNDDGTVNVFNKCQLGDKVTDIQGTATPAPNSYGAEGVFRVQFPQNPPPDCPGPNYIVQDFEDDFAIVQTSNFTTLFLLSRKQNVPDAKINLWLKQAEALGSDLTNVQKTNQTDCISD